MSKAALFRTFLVVYQKHMPISKWISMQTFFEHTPILFAHLNLLFNLSKKIKKGQFMFPQINIRENRH